MAVLLCGGTAGIIFAVAAIHPVASLAPDGVNPWSPAMFTAVLLLLLASGAAAAYLPARRAAKLDQRKPPQELVGADRHLPLLVVMGIILPSKGHLAVGQVDAKLLLEPIFEADFDPNAYGYRPKRSAQDAVQKVHELLQAGNTDVVDADLSKYLDRVPYCPRVTEIAMAAHRPL